MNNLSPAERRMVLDILYERFGALTSAYNNPETDRRSKRALRLKLRALTRLVNKFESDDGEAGQSTIK